MKIGIHSKEICPNCHRDMDFISINQDDFGLISGATYFCKYEATFHPVIGQILPENLTDNSILLPDEPVIK